MKKLGTNGISRYNEIDIKREINGKKQIPNYIIAFKVNGKINNMEEAIKAAKDWDKEIPIVVIDVDKSLKKGIESINKAAKEYESNKTEANLKKVWIEFYKTSITYANFYSKSKPKPIDFIELVELPEELKNKIDNKGFGKYSCKFEKVNHYTDKSVIKELMKKKFGEEVKNEKEVTFIEIASECVEEFAKKTEEEETIAQTIINGVKHILEKIKNKTKEEK